MATTTMDRGNPAVRGRVRRMMDRAIRALSTRDEDELRRIREEADELPDELREEARVERHEPPQERREPPPPREGGTEDETHFHVHMPSGTTARDQEMEQPDAGHEEPDGDEPATKGDIACLMDLIKELVDADDEGDDLDEEEADGGEVADRRIRVHDRRRRARDAIRQYHRRVHDEIGEIVETEHDPESTGRDDVPGSAGAGKEGINSLSVHDRARRRRTHDRATADSAGLKDAWDEVASRAEILHPGITLTEGGRKITFDSAVPAATTELRMCALRRRTLDAAYRTPEGREVIDAVTAGTVFNLAKAPCDAVAPIFNAAAAMRGERNNRRVVVGTPTHDGAGNKAPLGIGATAADLNAQNRARYQPRATR